MTQPDGTGQDRTAPEAQTTQQGLAGPAVALGVVALAAGLPDPWLPARLRHFAAILRAEKRIHRSYAQVVDRWLDEVRPAVVTRHGTVSTMAVQQRSAQFAREVVDDVVQVTIRETFERAYEEAGGWEPDANHYTARYLRGVSNRMSNVPDQVFNSIREATLKATEKGWSIDELAVEVHTLLDQNDVNTYANRALVTARTETIGAYNAGTLAGWQSYARQLGGDWEKAWLCTHDTHVRPTHLAADVGTPETGQRVPLGAPFAVGDALLDHPGAIGPAATPGEVIQCRCSMVLLRPGEAVDLSNRHYRRLP